MSKKNGKQMQNIPNSYVQLIEELQKENDLLRKELEELRQYKKDTEDIKSKK